ncbi:MAG: hypothetical protein VCA36_11175 [Opitutales bacterium]
MKNQADREDWNRLIWELADEAISEEDKDRLIELLRNQPEARKLYVRNMAIESLLQWESSPAEPLEQEPVTTGAPLVSFGRWFDWVRSPVAALLALGVGLAAFFALRSVQNSPVLTETPQAEEIIPERNLNPLFAALVVDPTLTKIEEVADLTITSERNEQGLLVQRIYFMETERVPAQPQPPVEQPLEEAVGGFDENELMVEASYPIDILESGQGFADEGRVEVEGEIAVWRGEDVLLTLSTDKGVLPYEGTDMIKFPIPVATTSADVAESTEILRVIDLRSISDEVSSHRVTARSIAFFNQAVGIADDGTSFVLRLHAIDREDGENRAIGREVVQIMADRDPKTWQQTESEIDLPAGTDYLVVSVSVRKEGLPQVIFANIGGSYVDAVNVSMEIDGRPVYGRL